MLEVYEIVQRHIFLFSVPDFSALSNLEWDCVHYWYSDTRHPRSHFFLMEK